MPPIAAIATAPPTDDPLPLQISTPTAVIPNASENDGDDDDVQHEGGGRGGGGDDGTGWRCRRGTERNYSWNQNRDWHGWSHNFCALQLVDVFQPNADQPIHLKVRNASQQRLQYTISVQIGNQTGTINVDNANSGETSERPTATQFRGNVRGQRAVLRVTSCSQRS